MMSLAPPSPDRAKSQNSRNRQSNRSDSHQSTTKNMANSSAIPGRFRQTMQALDQNIWLPDSPATFAFYIVAITVLCGGLFLHINLSAQITQTHFDIASIEGKYYEIERESAEIVSQIAIATSMFDIYGRATALGYVPVTDRNKNFVAATDIQIPQPGLAAANSDTTTNNSAPDQALANNQMQGITVAEAFEANGTVLSGSELAGSGEQVNGKVLALGMGGASLFSPTSETDSLSNRLISWWMSD